MESTQIEEGRRAELFVRSLVPETARSHQQSVTDRLGTLAEDGPLTEYTVTVWGKQLPATPADVTTPFGRRIHQHIAAFRKWARVNDRSLSPAFSLRSVDASLLDEQYRAIVLPQLLLVEYERESIRCVTPHVHGDTVVTVTDRLNDLESDASTTFTGLDRTTAETATDRLEIRGGTIGSNEPVASE